MSAAIVSGFSVMRLVRSRRRERPGGAATLVYKGTKGRWRNVLQPEDLLLYEQATSGLDPELRSWLESGRLGGARAGGA